MNKKQYTIYLAGPISGLSYDDAVNVFVDRSIELRGMGYNVIHPMLGKEYLRNELKLKEHGYKNPQSTNHAIVQTDFWRVDRADILYVDLTLGKERTSIGTVAEMSRAFAKNKLVVTVLPKENIHRHAFILEMSSLIFETTEDAEDFLRTFI